MTRRHRIAVVGCRRAPGAAVDDLYPDDDLPLLTSALEGLEADVTAVAWDDDTVDWGGVDAAVVRSTWDSVDRPREFLDWARRATAQTLLLNPVAAMAWNLDKTYLRELHDRGVPIVPTTWVTDDARWTPPATEFVVKPSVSAGGRETARYQPDDADQARRHVRRLLAAGHTVMVQPYVASVDEFGEAKLVHVDGALSHTVRVGALLEPGAGVVERPGSRGGSGSRSPRHQPSSTPPRPSWPRHSPCSAYRSSTPASTSSPRRTARTGSPSWSWSIRCSSSAGRGRRRIDSLRRSWLVAPSRATADDDHSQVMPHSSARRRFGSANSSASRARSAGSTGSSMRPLCHTLNSGSWGASPRNRSTFA